MFFSADLLLLLLSSLLPPLHGPGTPTRSPWNPDSHLLPWRLSFLRSQELSVFCFPGVWSLSSSTCLISALVDVVSFLLSLGLSVVCVPVVVVAVSEEYVCFSQAAVRGCMLMLCPSPPSPPPVSFLFLQLARVFRSGEVFYFHVFSFEVLWEGLRYPQDAVRNIIGALGRGSLSSAPPVLFVSEIQRRLSWR